LGSVLDKIGQFFEDIGDALQGIVEDIWNEIVAPIAEAIFNALGFEDETIINAYVVVSSLYGSDGYVNPFKKIPINRVTYGTEVYDEIMNIFISGEHIRIKAYMRKIDIYGRTPTSTISITTLPDAELKTIIEGIEGESITIVHSEIEMPNRWQYIQAWLQDNESTHGYVYNSALKSLTSGLTVYYINADDPWTQDVVNNAFDINVLSDITQEIWVSNAVNVLAAPASTYEITAGLETAVNTLAAPASTYNVLGGVITVDTAVDNSVPSVSGYSDKITVDTAVDASVPSADAEDTELDSGTTILQELVPERTAPSRQFQVQYTLDSDTGIPQAKYWWFYELEAQPRTYPQLYPDDPIYPGAEKQIVLPIVPMKQDSVWVQDAGGQEWLEVNRSMRRYGINASQMSNQLKNDPNGNDPDINSIFFMFGIRVSDAASQSEISYLWEMFADYASVNPDLSIAEYVALKEDQAFINNWLNGRVYHPVTKGNDQAYWTNSYSSERPRLITLLADYVDGVYADYEVQYQIDPVTGAEFAENFNFQTLPTDVEVTNARITDLKDAIDAKIQNNQTSYSITEGYYNITVSYGAVDVSIYAGDVGDGTVGNVSKTIEETYYVLTLKKQTNVNEITEVKVYDLTAFSYIRKDGSSVYLAALDFVGSDASGVNVKNNMVIPVTYGYLLELGIVKRKELLYRAAYINMFAVDVTKLRYYETESFLGFLAIALRVVAVVILVLSWGTSINVSTVLWSAAKYYASKLVVEYVMQQIILSNPDSKTAQALAFAFAIVASSLTGADIDWADSLTVALEAINATSQVVTAYTEIKSSELMQDSLEFVETSKEKNARLKQAIENQDIGSDALLDYIKETITMRFTDPSSFYNEKLTRNLVDQALELDDITDVQALLELNNIVHEI
jgi:hypothetical protein